MRGASPLARNSAIERVRFSPIVWRRRTARFLALPWRERRNLVSFVLGFHLVAGALRFWQYQKVVAALQRTTGIVMRRAPTLVDLLASRSQSSMNPSIDLVRRQ